MEYKSPLIIGLELDEFSDESGVDVISLVEQPAIESNFRYFNKQKMESYSDYPDAVSNNAKKGIELNEKVGNKCATQVGKVRAQQLAGKEPISVETIKRMYSYLSRAEEYYEEGENEKCGTISFLLWGGLAGKRWSESKLKELGLFQGDEYTDEELADILIEDYFSHKYIEDLPSDIQDKLYDALVSKGETQESLEADGWVLMKEEHQFTISSKPDLSSIQDYGSFKIRYKYTGPKDSKNRDFCRKVLNANLVFRKEDINQLTISGENQEFGIYDIFTYKGSYGCRHYWTQLTFQQVGDKEIKTEQQSIDAATSVNPIPTMNRNPNNFTHTFAKDSVDRQLIAGPLMVPNKTIYRYDDMMGEYWVYFSKKTIEKLAYKFMMDKNQRNTNIQHSEDMSLNDVILVESWLVENPEKDKSYEIMGETYEKGTWFGVMKVQNTSVWMEWVKTGRVKGFSVEGYFADKIINKFHKHQFYYRTTAGGTDIVVDEKSFVVFILKDGERVAILPDGVYELTNGKTLEVIDSKAKEGSF